MKSSTKRILGIIITTIVLLILESFVFDIFKIKEYGCLISLIIAFILSIILLGYTKNRSSNEKSIMLSIIVFTLLYLSLSFVFFGSKLGFLSSSYKLGTQHLFKIVIPTLSIIIISEILRYQFIEKGRSSKLIIILTTLMLIFVDFSINYSIYSLTTFKGVFELMAFVIFPSIMKNIMLTYNCYYYGYKTNIIYRILMEIPNYYLPIIPNISDYLQCVLNIIYPFVLLLYLISYTNNMILHPKKKEEVKKEHKTLKTVSGVILSVVLFVYVCFMSGLFKFYFLAVGSGSMEPKIQVGDLVLVEKTKDYDKLKIGDVLVYKKENKVILHRIVKIDDSSGKYIYNTKGDNNKSIDSWDIQEKDVIGKVRFKIALVGYPTVWLNRLFEGGN